MRTHRVAFFVLAGFVFGLCSGPSAESSRTLRRYNRAKAGYDEKALEAEASFVQLGNLNAGNPPETGNRGTPLESGNGGTPPESGSEWTPLETDIEGTPPETDNKGTPPDKENPPESGNGLTLLESGNEEKTHESDNEGNPLPGIPLPNDAAGGLESDMIALEVAEDQARKAIEVAEALYRENQCWSMFRPCGSEFNAICMEGYCCEAQGRCVPERSPTCREDEYPQLEYSGVNCKEKQARKEYDAAIAAFEKAKKATADADAADQEAENEDDEDDADAAPIDVETARANEEATRKALDAAIAEFEDKRCMGEYGLCGRRQGHNRICGGKYCCTDMGTCLPRNRPKCDVRERPQLKFGWTHCLEDRAKREETRALKASKKAKKVLEKAESQSGTPNISTSDGDGLDEESRFTHLEKAEPEI